MLRRRGGKYKRELRKRGSGSCGASRAGSVWVALAGRESYRYRMKLAEIKTAISGLSEQERVELAAWVLKSLDQLDEEEAERLWNEEAQRRLEEYRASRAGAVSAEDVAKKAADLFR